MADFDDGFVNPNFPLDEFSPPPPQMTTSIRSHPQAGGSSGAWDRSSTTEPTSSINRFDVPQSTSYGVQYVVTPGGVSQPQQQQQKQHQQRQQPQQQAWQYSGLADNAPASQPVHRPADRAKDTTASKDVWTMSSGERRRYEQQFKELPTSSGYLPGEQARTFFVKSKLPTADLSAIWRLSDIDKDGQLSVDEFSIAMHLTVARRKGKPIPETTPLSLLPESKKEDHFDSSSTEKKWVASKQPDVVTAVDQAFQPTLNLRPPPSSRVGGSATSPISPVKPAPVSMLHVTLPGVSPKSKSQPDYNRAAATAATAATAHKKVNSGNIDEIDSGPFVRNRIDQFESAATDSGSELPPPPPPPVEKPKDLLDDSSHVAAGGGASSVDLLAPPSLPPKKKSQVKKSRSVREKGKKRDKYSILGDEESLIDDPFDAGVSATLSRLPVNQPQGNPTPSSTAAAGVQNPAPPPQHRHLLTSQTAPVIVVPPQQDPSSAQRFRIGPLDQPASSASVVATSTPPPKRSPSTKEKKGHSRSSSLDINIVFKTEQHERQDDLMEAPASGDQQATSEFDFPPALPPRDFPVAPPKRKPKKPAPEPPLKGHMIPVTDGDGGSPSTRKGHKKAVSLDAFSSKATRDFTQELRAKSPDDPMPRRKEASVSPPPSLPDVTEAPQPTVVRREKKKAPPVPLAYHRRRESMSPEDFVVPSTADTYATVNKPKKDRSALLDATRKLKNQCLALERLNGELSENLIKVKEERQRLQVQLENLKSTSET